MDSSLSFSFPAVLSQERSISKKVGKRLLAVMRWMHGFLVLFWICERESNSGIALDVIFFFSILYTFCTELRM